MEEYGEIEEKGESEGEREGIALELKAVEVEVVEVELGMLVEIKEVEAKLEMLELGVEEGVFILVSPVIIFGRE